MLTRPRLIRFAEFGAEVSLLPNVTYARLAYLLCHQVSQAAVSLAEESQLETEATTPTCALTRQRGCETATLDTLSQ